MSDTLFQRGDLVWCHMENKREWKRGIVTDVFVAPITNKEVVVMGGDGFYAEDVMPDAGSDLNQWDVPEPVRGQRCECGAYVYIDRADGLVRVLGTREPHTCPVPEPQSLRVAP